MLPGKIDFIKLNSAGNDFICLDNTESIYADLFADPEATAVFARLMCRRGLAVGADGLIVANQVDDGDANTIIARFLEPDGSEARLCGNGTACFTYWAIAIGLVPGPEVEVLTQAGTARGRLTEGEEPGEVQVCIPDPTRLEYGITLSIEGREWTMATVDIGVPHAIIYVDDIDRIDVNYWGRLIRRHPRFQPDGINVNFIQILKPKHLSIRTFEFGVESETLACGTGSAAASIIACLENKWGANNHDCHKSIHVHPRSGRQLRVRFHLDDRCRVSNVCMESIVLPVYQASLCAEFRRELELAIKGRR